MRVLQHGSVIGVSLLHLLSGCETDIVECCSSELAPATVASFLASARGGRHDGDAGAHTEELALAVLMASSYNTATAKSTLDWIPRNRGDIRGANAGACVHDQHVWCA